MAVNLWIKPNVKAEQNLYENLVLESIKIYGQETYYLPRDIVNENTIFGDDVPSTFNSSYKVEMYIDNIEGFEGEGDLFTKFGVEIRDEATFVVARRRWNDTVSMYDNDINSERPREGDLIYLPMSKSLFEIRHVEHEQPFYQLNNVPVFKCRATLFEYNDEDLDTGVDDIDKIERDYAYKYILTLGADSIITTIGNTAKQTLSDGTVLTGEVAKYSDSDDKLHLIHVGANDGNYHTFQTGINVVLSGLGRADSSISVTAVTEDNQISQNEQNTSFSDFTDFLDFSEGNPFGDPENN
mgnify:CR=1 FL=1|tara:strand:+ start:4103 stop:4993 length:891 start_codon:yes stop_codon:yes gene_type:complete